MPYRRRLRRRFGRRRAYRRRPTLRGLRTAVKRLRREGSQIVYLTNRVQASAVGSTTGLSNTSPYFYHPHGLSLCTPLFGTTSADLSSNALTHRWTTIRVRFELNSEDDPTKFVMYFVRLTRYAQRLLNFSNGGLNALIPGTDFNDPATLTTNDVALLSLSPKYFKVLYRKAFDSKLSWFGTPDNTTVMTGQPRQYTWSKTFRIKKRYRMVNPDGNAVDLPCSPVVQQNYYIMVFSDNSLADGQSPTMDINEVSSWIAST